VEGRRAVLELLRAGRRRVRSVLLSGDAERDEVLDEIAELAGPSLRVANAEKVKAAARTDAHQGVVASAQPLQAADVDELLDADDAFLVALDGVTDPQNLGAVMRTAASAGATGIVLPRHRAVHVTPTVAKAAAGAIEHLPIAVVPGLPTALTRARELGVWSVGLDARADRSIFDVEVVTDPVLVVLGAEGAGLGRLTRQRCDVVAAIPLRGPLDSLNVSAAAAVACFEVARRRLG
ncbi:MAG TPA: 23S rRNA (guanosine(2251)-2'-O)-methyltransferase RlmB, partial [Acidimicrobiales bacterium]|nr:23S rRNA (guanosine(2251)-2'-O)-methyltransferase RlmB [Acidimicrobiales bacterium]